MNILIKQFMRSLPASYRKQFKKDLQRTRKSTMVGYICWLFAAHHLYLRNIPAWLLYCITLGGFGVWAIIDLLRMNGLVNRYNDEKTRELTAQYRAML